MMISAEFPKPSLGVILQALNDAMDHVAISDDDLVVVSDFAQALHLFSKEESLVLCKSRDYHRMSDNEDKLLMLQGYGVDNWEGYDDAMEEYWIQKEAE